MNCKIFYIQNEEGLYWTEDMQGNSWDEISAAYAYTNEVTARHTAKVLGAEVVKFVRAKPSKWVDAKTRPPLDTDEMVLADGGNGFLMLGFFIVKDGKEVLATDCSHIPWSGVKRYMKACDVVGGGL